MSKPSSKKITPIRAIRAHCLECMGGSAQEVDRCVSENCNVFRYRLGKNPARRGIGCPQNFLKAQLSGQATSEDSRKSNLGVLVPAEGK